MGDRAQVCIRDGVDEVYLYTHCGGSTLIDDVRAALLRADKANRLDDNAYLARIVFCQLMPVEDHYGTSFYGITATETDGRLLTIDARNQTIQSDEYGVPIQSLKDFINSTEEYGDDEDEEADHED